MKHSLLALAALGAFGASTGDIPQQAFRMPRIRTSKNYPEQSSRQAMRQFRRQQGGPGIALNPLTHQYEPIV